ncbi:helix-turn-helix transcriptional regulator [Catenulispora subtropica]
MVGERSLSDPAPAAALGESRARVLELLRTAAQPLGVQDIAEQTGLHPNTARFHLDGLVEDGYAQRDTEDRDQPGRPRTVYQAVPGDAAAGLRSYRLLAEILTTLVAENVPRPEQLAREAGHAWGGYLTERPAPYERLNPPAATRRLVGILSEIGFAPQAQARDDQSPGDADGVRIELRHCPFREVAEHHRNVVCSLHLGLMQGALDVMRAPLQADRLDPFVEPSLCMAHLSPSNRNHGEDTQAPASEADPDAIGGT